MAWSTSTRKQSLPKDWERIRGRILERDEHRCVALDAYGRRCKDQATDVDHIDQKRSWDHSPKNLQSLCRWHHAKKSSEEGNEAMRARLEKADTLFRRPDERPGAVRKTPIRKTPRPPSG